MRLSNATFRIVWVGTIVATTLLSGCATNMADQINTQWDLADPKAVTSQSISLDLKVTRIGCGSGVTGEITASQVSYSNEDIAIGLVAEPLKGNAQTCQSNETVPYTLTLDEPLGQRKLIDSSCTQSAEQDSATEDCQVTAVRWNP